MKIYANRAGDGVASIKRHRRDQSSDDVRNMATASGRDRLKEDLESFTWQRRLDYKATPSRFRKPAFVFIDVDMSRKTRVVQKGYHRCAARTSRSRAPRATKNANQPNETNMNDLESDDESVDTRLVSPFPHSDNDSDNDEVLNELIEYENAGMLRREKATNSFDGDDLAFQCMIGFRKSVAYFDPFLPVNIITRKANNTIMVEGFESTEKNLVVIVRDVYVFVGSLTYIMSFVVLEDIGEFIQINKAEVVMGKPFRKTTKLEYDCAKGLMYFNRIFDN
nr:hypothetical protein [Tanacetum cinerariifolium]